MPETNDRPALTLLIWDTDGNFGQTIFSSVYLKNASAAIIVGDSTRPATLKAMAGLAAGWREARAGRPLSLLLNKSDLLPDADTPELPAELRAETTEPLFKTSAKTGENVDVAFHATADAILRRGL